MSVGLAVTDDFVDAVARRVADLLAGRPTADGQGWLTVAETATFLGCSVDHVRNLYRAGEVRAYRPAKAYLIDPQSVEDFVRSHPVR